MKEKCVICGSTDEHKVVDLICLKIGCFKRSYYCLSCYNSLQENIRCPRHFLKAHREDVARYKKEVSK